MYLHVHIHVHVHVFSLQLTVGNLSSKLKCHWTNPARFRGVLVIKASSNKLAIGIVLEYILHHYRKRQGDSLSVAIVCMVIDI